jgi:mRNA interferase MazF
VTLRKGDVYDVDTGKGVRTVLVVSLDGLAQAYGAVVALVPDAPAAHPDMAMSVRLSHPVVAVNLPQLSASRFDTAHVHGNIGPEQQARIDNALRAVLDL